jgi:hypothetical protein
VNVSLAMLRKQLYAMRSWDSSGETQNTRILQALNVALDRMANDVPQALIPDEEHVVLYPDVVSTDSSVLARVVTFSNDKRLLKFVDSAGVGVGDPRCATTWVPTVTGEWDGLMHIEITDSSGRVHRRQCIDWWTKEESATIDGVQTTYKAYIVTLDRPYNEIITPPTGDIYNNTPNQGGGTAGLEFRIHQPEFFVSDDVVELLEPARIFDGSRQQVWKIDTAGAGRQDMRDFQGDSKGRPYRSWRGRHFQLPAPTEAPFVMEANSVKESDIYDPGNPAASTEPLSGPYKWETEEGLRRGKWAICYTYVLGRRDEEWQQSPLVTPGGDTEQDSTYGLTWAYHTDSAPVAAVNRFSGIHDPQFESAPSPVTMFTQSEATGDPGAMVISATNIDSMLGFGDSDYDRYGRTGMRIRYYVAHIDANETGEGNFNNVETNYRFYLLCEVEPTFDLPDALAAASVPVPLPPEIEALGESAKRGARIIWTGSELYDYHRPLKHSTGYYAWKVFPHQDARYELDFRVSRLPRKFIDDQDTAPIHPEAVPTLIELALYYVSLVDGNDQISAQAHLSRYQDLVRVFRDRYANTGRIVEPVPILGYSQRHRYGTFSSSE